MEKAKVALVVDSTANLSKAYLDQYNIDVIPLNVIWDGESLKDGVDITVNDFYSRLQSSDSMPTTSQPSVGEFVDFFKQVAEKADSIVGIFISDELSGTLASARAAVDMLPEVPIAIIDSRSTSMAMGLMALEVARAIEAGKDFDEVSSLAQSLVDKINIIFVVDTLEYLHKGGRIGGARRLLGSILSIKPLLHLVDGRIEALASVRTKRKAIQKLLSLVAEAEKTPAEAAVLHAASPAEAEKVCQMLSAQQSGIDIIQADLSPVIGTHVGPGALGIAYRTN